MRDFTGRVAAITGAGSGMGRALALELARRRCHVALSDVDPDGLEETVLLAKRTGVDVSSAVVDVADRAAVERWADDVVAHHGRANLIFNNAGVALAATVEGASYPDLEWILGINLWGVIHGTKAFLPHLKVAGEGHVVNTSSVFGLAGIPSQSAYNATKFAVRGFTESLRLELDIERCGVSATAIHPGGIKTSIVRRARIDPTLAEEAGGDAEARDGFEKLFITSAEKAARQIIVAVQKNKRRAMVGPDAHVIDLMTRLPPGLYQRLIALGARRARD